MSNDIVGALLCGMVVGVVVYFLAGTYFTNQHSLEELRKIVKVLEELKRNVE